MSPTRLRIRELRQGKNLTQAQLAELAGVRQATISDLESGKSRRLLEVIDKLARALKVEPGDLLERAPARPRRKA